LRRVPRRVVMGLQFFPRGGSAHVAAYLAGALPRFDVTIVSGSVAGLGDARHFYRGLDVRPVDMTAAMRAPDPMLADPPLHGSFEDRPGAPDRVFCAIDDATYEHHVAAWSAALSAAGPADLLHLHHLTPLNAAAGRAAPGVPVVGHLHGTELLMLEEAARDPGRWAHTAAWQERLTAWARDCARLIVLSASQVERAQALLGVDPGRCVAIPNGFDPDTFGPREVEPLSFWRRHLVEDPQGWGPEGETIGYAEADLAAFDGTPVLLYVGRFTAVKRVPLLVEAYARSGVSAPLVLLGGHPGEWEGEHPAEAVRRTGARNVFLAGWHGHDELPSFLAASSVLVLPSVREQFGQVLVEAMACGLPTIAVDAQGPAEIVRDGVTGRLVPPDDAAALARALVEAVDDPEGRRRRGLAAMEDARERFRWPALAARVADLYDEILDAGP
jgi:glycosyltransferase involved in cell wall biosynthesis